MRLGAVVELLTSCSGHVLLAYMSPEELQRGSEVVASTDEQADASAQRNPQSVRDRGYEMKLSARTDGITDIGYPIRGLDRRVIAAMTVPYLRVLDKSLPTTIQQTRQLLAETARKVSEAMGSSGDVTAPLLREA